jgi:hypothetical protein
MNIEELKKLSVQDAIKKASEYAGVDPSVLDGIWNTESARGKKMLSPAGARGHFGLMPPTQAAFERKLGVKINPDDFHESLFIAAAHIKDDLKREGGDIVSALRAYNNGPNWRNQKDPRGENAAYAQKVLGKNTPSQPVQGATVQPPAGGAVGISTTMPAAVPQAGELPTFPKTTAVLASASFLDQLSPVSQTKVDYNEAVTRLAADSATRQAEIENTSFVDVAQAMFMHQGIIGGTLKRAARPDFPETPGFIPPESKLQGFSADDQAHLLDAKSQDELDYRTWEIKQEQEDMRRASLHGGWYAAAAGIFAGLPEGVITGVGLAKTLAVAGMGSAAALQAGQTGRAIGLNVLENVGGNVALTAVEDAISGRMSLFDYAVAGSVGALFTGLQAPGMARAGSVAAQRVLAERVAAEAMDKQIAVGQQAARNLGEGATAEGITKEIERLELAEAKRSVTIGPVDDTRRLLPDMEKLEADEQQFEVSTKAVWDADNTVSMDRGPATGPVVMPLIGNKGMFSPWNSMDQSQIDVLAFRADNKPKLQATMPDGYTLEQVKDLRPDLYLSKADRTHHLAGTAAWLQKTFLPDSKVFLSFDGKRAGGALGTASRLNDGGYSIIIGDGSVRTLMHEFGHAIVVTHWANASPTVKAGMQKFHKSWVNRYTGAEDALDKVPGYPGRLTVALERSLPDQAMNMAKPRTPGEASLFDLMAGNVDSDGKPVKAGADRTRAAKEYWPNFDEMGAEQFVKWMESVTRGAEAWKPSDLPRDIIDWVKGVWDKLTNMFRWAKDNKYLGAEASFAEFFDAARKGTKPAARKAGTLGAKQGEMKLSTESLQVDAASKYGLDILPESTANERAEKKALIALYEKASNPEAHWNNIDPKWVDTLTAKFPAIGSTGLLMLRSKNPVARMVASELLESTTGAGGRRTTASIAKYMAERKFMGNVINDVQDNYTIWRNAQGGNIGTDVTDGKLWKQFNVKVAEAIEAQRSGSQEAFAPEVLKAAGAVEAAYERMRIAQIQTKTIGWAGLPETSKGYMPHKMSSVGVRNMTNEQARAFHSALVDQFISTEGWDISFSSNLASKYIDRARVRAMGGHDIPMNVHQTGAADVVEEALKAAGLTQVEVKAQLAKFMRGGASHTKGRLKLDLLQEHVDGDNTFRLLDLFETDQIQLIRSQAQRVSGEVALARHGIMGKPGLALLRRAMADFGTNDGKAQPPEIDAFDQVSAEFLGSPFGDYGGKWMNRAMQTNSLARLGGMGFTQFAESINIATHLGVTRAMGAISSMPRLRAEAAALARGEKVKNPIIGSIELAGGAEFGTDAYKMVFPFDNPGLQYQVNGHDTVTMADRLLRGGLHAQGKLSGWRAIHGAQQRGVAEQIVHKAVKFIRDGGDDVALTDMGISPELAAAMRNDLPVMAKFDGAGRLVEFDITKAQNLKAAEEFIQAVHRGTGQIIQGTFIGETGKWAHSGWLRLMTQFRTFSITSVEKQWARNRNNHGVGVALAMMLGAMSVAWPIHVARSYVNSIGREDREAYLERQLAPEHVARATMNYIAMSGLAGDFLDALSAVSGVGKSTGGRSGGTTEFVGTVIAPAAGLADDLWRSIQNSKDGTDIHEVVKNLPFAKLPFLVPAINALDD